MEIQKDMYALLQADKVFNDELKLHLAKFGYDQATTTPDFRRHQTLPIQF